MIESNIKNYGYARANRDGKNMLSFRPCTPCDDVSVCQDEIQIDKGVEISGFTYTDIEGVAHEVAFDAPVVEPADIRKAVAAKLQDFESRVWVRVNEDTDDYMVLHRGEGTVTFAEATETLRLCNVKSVCDTKFLVAGEPDTSVKVTEITIAETLIPLTITTHLDAASLEAELNSVIQGAGFSSVASVMYDSNNNVYEVRVTDDKGVVVLLDGQEGIVCDCKEVFA